MRVSIHHRCADFNSYRAARVKSLFNVDSGADVYIDADLPLDARPWQIGVIVGPSGTGKTSIGRRLGARHSGAGLRWFGYGARVATTLRRALQWGTIPRQPRPRHLRGTTTGGN